MEHTVNGKSGFADMRVTRYGYGHTRRWRQTEPYKNKKPPPGIDSLIITEIDIVGGDLITTT